MSQEKIETICINNVEYVRKDSVNQTAEKLDGMKYVVVRTYSAGVFVGYLKSEKDQTIELVKVRRLYQWAGSATLSQIAMEGTKNPSGCKFPMEQDSIKLFQVIEIAPMTEMAKKSIASVPVWKN